MLFLRQYQAGLFVYLSAKDRQKGALELWGRQWENKKRNKKSHCFIVSNVTHHESNNLTGENNFKRKKLQPGQKKRKKWFLCDAAMSKRDGSNKTCFCVIFLFSVHDRDSCL